MKKPNKEMSKFIMIALRKDIAYLFKLRCKEEGRFQNDVITDLFFEYMKDWKSMYHKDTIADEFDNEFKPPISNP